jgi:hypothetical protein
MPEEEKEVASAYTRRCKGKFHAFNLVQASEDRGDLEAARRCDRDMEAVTIHESSRSFHKTHQPFYLIGAPLGEWVCIRAPIC